MNRQSQTRRRFLQSLGTGVACLGAQSLWLPGAFAEQLTATVRQTEGPFYPDRLPIDRDNDLLIVDDSLTPADGIAVHLHGRILDLRGRPLHGALVEIWQVDSKGVYLHSGSFGHARRDSHFQGYGRFETGSDGKYYFRTLRPVPYPGRTPHIHVAVSRPGQPRFTTQCYIRGEAQNLRDGLFTRIPAALRETVLTDFVPRPESPLEQNARFDIVLGLTPAG
ncbi:protocatechuate 3,4-dioxygenase subunit beta [Marinobacterium nitratireducens]|uniref:Protocatechuate 3,4-dioxygenase subunit beta n=1 Tax=Marinobacterium nitratireducens TaxID=518897 RepID=A0A917ZHR4_9GAMM|nr:protocatechuate 3,4-dioxygenase [Marinobacterium nitratireducens]GGO82254.1 protocatechuate 3,4-dioxygenase subunit beta [Marinobacterium nitratireducens]